MKKQYITIAVLLVLLTALIAVAAITYGSIADDYTPPTIETTENANTDENVQIEQTADFTVVDKDSVKCNLSDFFGKPIVVNFWATWCSPCTSEMPHFEEAFKTYGDSVQFIMVNVGDTLNDALSFVSKNGYTFPVYHDSTYSASYAYGVSSIPKTLFIDANGVLVHSQVGMLSAEALQSNIDKIK